jgi:putative molybdopterin biosynthesis protein
MTIYLRDIPLAQALSRLETALEQAGLAGLLGIEEILLDEGALGRVLAEPVWAKISSPHYHASAMDGFAVRSIQTKFADLNSPVLLPLQGRAVYVDTGDPLPMWADAVIPIENVEPVDEEGRPADDPRHPQAIRIRAAVTPWSHIRPLGEDMVATQLVLPAGQVLRPVDLGAVAASGHSKLRVAKKPRVAVIPTGTELVPIGTEVQAGDIIEYNSLVLAMQVNNWGGQARRYPITPDQFDAIRSRVAEAAQEHDLVLLNAGSSAGSEDFSAQVIETLGSVLVHGVAVRPGHPVILGILDLPDRHVPVIGVPGYPVSAALTGEIFVEPLMARWLGRKANVPITIQAKLTRKVTSARMTILFGLSLDGWGKMLAAPLARAGVITSLVRADGLVRLTRGVQGVQAGEVVDVLLYRSPPELENTIFAIGSHDVILDLLAQHLADKGRRLVTANVGSLAGMVALRRCEAHLAGSHLLDPETGDYNLSYIKEYLPGMRITLINLVGRQQGLMTARGNPKSIHSLDDLFREDVSFINRQRGAGTRVLLDYHLSGTGRKTHLIKGYEQEEYTHLAVAAAVASGRADCGLGIAAAAQALELDFIPLFEERYDLVIPKEFAESELLQPLLETIRNLDFKKAVKALPGYNIDQMGLVVAELEPHRKSIGN